MKRIIAANRQQMIRAGFVLAAFIGIMYPAEKMLEAGMDWGIAWPRFLFGFVQALLLWYINLSWSPNLDYYFPRFRGVRFGFYFRVAMNILITLGVALISINFEALSDVEPGAVYDIPKQIGKTFFLNSLLMLFFYTIETNLRIQSAIHELHRVREENLEAQFGALKQQINPHFLFNSLNVLKVLAKTHDPKTEEFVQRLSDFYRNLLSKNEQPTISLEEELRVLEDFAFLMQVRFEDKASFQVNVDPKFFHSRMPPLTLQMLVENCLKHNVVAANRPLLVEVFSSEADACIVVRNNLQPKRTIDQGTQVGLDNISRRYRLIAKKEISIVKTDEHFIVKLPILAS